MAPTSAPLHSDLALPASSVRLLVVNHGHEPVGCLSYHVASDTVNFSFRLRSKEVEEGLSGMFIRAAMAHIAAVVPQRTETATTVVYSSNITALQAVRAAGFSPQQQDTGVGQAGSAELIAVSRPLRPS